MDNFLYHSPTKVFFGRGEEEKIGAILQSYAIRKVLLHYGGGSIRQSGLYDTVVSSLCASGIAFIELGGVEPNPKLPLVRKGIELCRAENVELILAVGGGSVIDSSKAIGMGLKMKADVWDLYSGAHRVTETLPVGVILTLAAAGSELSNSSVITNPETKLKRGHNNDVSRPLFAVLNPALTFTVSKFQTACGIVDIIMHTAERYFGTPAQTELTDSFAEGLMRTTIAAGKRAYADPNDYEARGELMWASSLSHNGLTGNGRTGDWATHQMEHEISGMFDRVAHGAGLSVLFPAWAKYVYKHNPARFAAFAVRVFGVTHTGNDEETALTGILAAEAFFKSIDMPTRLADLDIGEESIEPMAAQAFGARETMGFFTPICKQDMIAICKLALR